MKITGLGARHPFPTTQQAGGPDSMNQGDDSATYVVLRTDQAGLEGHGLTFTNGRGGVAWVAESSVGAVAWSRTSPASETHTALMFVPPRSTPTA